MNSSESLFAEKDFPVYILTSFDGQNHFGMLATWVMKASLRTDNLRFTIALSKYNESTKVILKSGRFVIH